MNFRLNLFLILLLVGSSLFAQEIRSYLQDDGLVPRERSVDFKHLKLELKFQPDQKLVEGTAIHRFVVLQESIDTLFLDAIKMNFSEVLLDGKPTKFTSNDKGITLLFEQPLSWDTQHEVKIQYSATPRRGIYFVGWDDATGRSRKQIWTQGQGIDNRHWIPMYDERNDLITTETIIHFDEKFEVLSNGIKLKEKKVGNQQKLWHYKMKKPHAPYLIMLGVGDYAIEELSSKSKTPICLYYYPDQKEQYKPTYRYTKQLFDYFEEEIGVPYPWGTYAQIPVQEFMYGAMENTTATIFGDFYLIDERGYLDRNYVRVNAHELAHQWFGDMITARSPAHHWLQESFATHYDMDFQKVAFGQDHFDWVRNNYIQQALNASMNDYKPIAHSEAGTVRHYPKGAFVLEMLKYVVGRDQFNAGIKYYLEKHAHSNVDSDDLLTAFHERLGLSLNWFWEQWVYKGGEPHYAVSQNIYEEVLNISVQQVHEQNDLVGLFKMPIWIEVYYTDGTNDRRKVWIEKEYHTFSFKKKKDQEVAYVLFDPNHQVMSKVDFEKPMEMLQKQATEAVFMLDRYEAIVALEKYDFFGKTDFLLDVYEKENFHGIKSEIVGQIMSKMDPSLYQIVKLGLEDPDAEVRKSVLNNTLTITADLEPLYKECLMDSSYFVVEKGLNLLSFHHPENVEKYLEITKGEIGNRAKNIRIEWLKQAIRNTNDKVYVDELVDYTSPSFNFLCRVKAAEALQDLNLLNEQALANMINAMFSFNGRLRAPIKAVVDHFYGQFETKKLIMAYVASQKWSDREFKKMSKYLLY